MTNTNSSRTLTVLLVVLSVLIGLSLGRLLYKTDMGYANKKFSDDEKLSVLISMINSNYVDSIAVDSIIEKIIPKLLTELDPHSSYISASNFAEIQAPLDGSFEGIGVQFNVQNDTILIIDVISGGPSEKEGLLPGDRIITINDSLFAGKKINSDDVIKNLKGKKGSKVTVGIKRSGHSELLSYTITRDKIPLYSIDADYMYDNEIGYIKIDRFAQTTYAEFMQALTNLKSQGMTKLILDLRGNSGGYLTEATDIADEFLPKGDLIVFTQGRARPKKEYFATNNSNSAEELEVAVLIDSWSASASEILAGALQDNDRATIIGRRSFGKGLVQEPILFDDGSSVRLTVARYYTPTGRSIQKPYTKDDDDYATEIYNRIKHGELQHEDSTLFADSLKFVTKKGKIVYGGGGIMPDIFVAVDTTEFTNFYDKITAKNLIYQYAIQYADNNRDVLSKLDKADKIVSHLNAQNIFNRFVEFAKKKNITSDDSEIETSKRLITVQLNSYIIRNILGEDDFYRVYHQIDNIFIKAVEILK